jgi:hypothetical protein
MALAARHEHGASRAALALARIKGPFGLRAEGIAALAGLAALGALAATAALSPARAQPLAPPEAGRISDGPEAGRISDGPEAGRISDGPEAGRISDGQRAGRIGAAPRVDQMISGAPQQRQIVNPAPETHRIVNAAAAARNDGPGPWTVVDLGIARLEEHCVAAARIALMEVARRHGADLMRRTAWTVEVLGLNHGLHDAVIACTYVATTKTRAVLMLHSGDGGGVEAMAIARAVTQSFAHHSDRITDEWLNGLDG